MTLLKTAAKIGGIYFLLFSIFYVIRFLSAYRAFINYHSTPTGVNIAYSVREGTIIFENDLITSLNATTFTILAIPAIIGVVIWVYWVMSDTHSDKKEIKTRVPIHFNQDRLFSIILLVVLITTFLVLAVVIR